MALVLTRIRNEESRMWSLLKNFLSTHLPGNPSWSWENSVLEVLAALGRKAKLTRCIRWEMQYLVLPPPLPYKMSDVTKLLLTVRLMFQNSSVHSYWHNEGFFLANFEFDFLQNILFKILFNFECPAVSCNVLHIVLKIQLKNECVSEREHRAATHFIDLP